MKPTCATQRFCAKLLKCGPFVGVGANRGGLSTQPQTRDPVPPQAVNRRERGLNWL